MINAFYIFYIYYYFYFKILITNPDKDNYEILCKPSDPNNQNNGIQKKAYIIGKIQVVYQEVPI